MSYIRTADRYPRRHAQHGPHGRPAPDSYTRSNSKLGASTIRQTSGQHMHKSGPSVRPTSEVQCTERCEDKQVLDPEVTGVFVGKGCA